MASKNVLIKASGDVTWSSEFLNFTRRKAKDNYVVVICGGGTKVSKELKAAGYEVRFDENHGRITETLTERRIARDVLECEAQKLEDRFVGKGVVVLPPILYAGSVLCHINADNLVKAYYLGFDEIYVFTRQDRLDAKQESFRSYPKVQVIGVISKLSIDTPGVSIGEEI